MWRMQLNVFGLAAVSCFPVVHFHSILCVGIEWSVTLKSTPEAAAVWLCSRALDRPVWVTLPASARFSDDQEGASFSEGL